MCLNICNLELGNGFLDVIPKAQTYEEKTDKLDFIKINNFCSVYNTVKKVKTQRTGESIYKSHILYLEYIKNSYDSIIKI